MGRKESNQTNKTNQQTTGKRYGQQNTLFFFQYFTNRVVVEWAEIIEEPSDDQMSDVKIVHVKNLSSDVNEDLLRKTFEAHGKIHNVQKVRDYAFIHFDKREDALAAIEALNGTELGKTAITVDLSKSSVVKNRRRDNQKRMGIMQYRHNTMDRGERNRGGRGNRGRGGNRGGGRSSGGGGGRGGNKGGNWGNKGMGGMNMGMMQNRNMGWGGNMGFGGGYNNNFGYGGNRMGGGMGGYGMGGMGMGMGGMGMGAMGMGGMGMGAMGMGAMGMGGMGMMGGMGGFGGGRMGGGMMNMNQKRKMGGAGDLGNKKRR